MISRLSRASSCSLKLRVRSGQYKGTSASAGSTASSHSARPQPPVSGRSQASMRTSVRSGSHSGKRSEIGFMKRLTNLRRFSLLPRSNSSATSGLTSHWIRSEPCN